MVYYSFTIMQRIVLVDMRFLYIIMHGTWIIHAIDLNGLHDKHGTRRRTLSDETTFDEVDHIYTKKIFSLIKRDVTRSGAKTIYSVMILTPHKLQGPFNSRQYDMHDAYVEPLTEWMYTWTAKYKAR